MEPETRGDRYGRRMDLGAPEGEVGGGGVCTDHRLCLVKARRLTCPVG